MARGDPGRPEPWNQMRRRQFSSAIGSPFERSLKTPATSLLNPAGTSAYCEGLFHMTIARFLRGNPCGCVAPSSYTGPQDKLRNDQTDQIGKSDVRPASDMCARCPDSSVGCLSLCMGRFSQGRVEDSRSTRFINKVRRFNRLHRRDATHQDHPI